MMNKNIYAIYHDVYVERCQKSTGGEGGSFSKLTVFIR